MEIFKELKCDPTYQISNLGNILHNGNPIKGFSDGRGYLKIRIKGRNFKVHRLVAITFLGKPYKRTIVNHKNCNKHDNRVDNLEWCTVSQNIKHAWDNGCFPQRRMTC